MLPFAFYGTLLEGLPAKPTRPRFEPLGRYLGECVIPGVLEDCGPYPRLVRGVGKVKGQLWQPESRRALALLDAWEIGDLGDPGTVLCERRQVCLLDPDIDAWVYVYEPTADAPRVASGDWRSLPKAHDLDQLMALRARSELS